MYKPDEMTKRWGRREEKAVGMKKLVREVCSGSRAGRVQVLKPPDLFLRLRRKNQRRHLFRTCSKNW